MDRQHKLGPNARSPHHCPLLVGEVDADGTPTTGHIFRAGLPRGRAGGRGGHVVTINTDRGRQQ